MATMNTPSTPPAPNPTLKAYEDKVRAQVQEAKSKLEQFEAKAKAQHAETEITAINRLKTAKQDIEQKLRGLKTAHDEHLARAKAEIDQDVSKFKASIDTLSGKLRG
jgi:F0F1-type ATP synthase membrane subunit b/b'